MPCLPKAMDEKHERAFTATHEMQVNPVNTFISSGESVGYRKFLLHGGRGLARCSLNRRCNCDERRKCKRNYV